MRLRLLPVKMLLWRLTSIRSVTPSPNRTIKRRKINQKRRISFVAGLFGFPVFPVLPPTAAKWKERTPRARAGGLAALLHLLPFQHHGKTEKSCLLLEKCLTFNGKLAIILFVDSFHAGL